MFLVCPVVKPTVPVFDTISVVAEVSPETLFSPWVQPPPAVVMST